MKWLKLFFFEPQQQFVVDSFKNCEGLGRVAIMDGGSVVMLGKVVGIEFSGVDDGKKAGVDSAAGGKKNDTTKKVTGKPVVAGKPAKPAQGR